MSDMLPTTQPQAEVLKEIKELVDEVYSKKLASDKAEKEYKDAKNKLAEIMEQSGVDKMAGDTCNASLSLKTSVTVPKEDDKKAELFEYIKKEHGQDVLDRMLTINARSFSSWYDKEIAAKVAEGDVEFQLPMLSPYDYYSVGLRKRAAKK